MMLLQVAEPNGVTCNPSNVPPTLFASNSPQWWYVGGRTHFVGQRAAMKIKVRYQLSWLLALVVALGPPFAWLHYELRRRAACEEALRSIINRGASVSTNAAIEEHWLYSLAEGDVYFDRVESVDANDCDFGDGDLAKLQCLPRLEQVSLSNTKVTDAGLLHLAEIGSLKRILLHRSLITEEGLRRFHKAKPDVDIFPISPNRYISEGFGLR
jgi:hypothetical protein